MKLTKTPLQLPRLRPYVPKPDDPAIFWFNSERDDIVREVTDRVAARHSTDRKRLELALNDTAFHEIRRLETQRDEETKQSLGFWRGIAKRVGRMSDAEKTESLRKMVEHMARDVAGNFDPRVYHWSGSIVPRLLTAVMQPSALPADLLGREAKLDTLLTVEGETEMLRRLAKIGTLVVVPTHSSNMDSVVLGYALERAGLPPVVYGAGKNLFTNPIISFFMHNLGAYRVDRRVKAALYKEVLKTYACVMIERGYHSLFFPGGTRSRSGLIEQHLKLGLAGSAVEAFARNEVRGVKRPVFFVPTTINYALVLEAETLIEDWLAETGKSRYIIENDEFSRLDRWVAFFRKLLGLSGGCVLRFGRPVDPFGNDVDESGHSIGPQGQLIDPSTYVLRDGAPVVDPAREAAYTRGLGERLAERYLEETVIMSTQLVAHLLFRRLVRATPNVDLFGRLRLRGEVAMSRGELVGQIGSARDTLREAGVRLSPVLRRESPERILERSLDAWNGYHRRTAAREIDGEVTAEDPTLLLYYQNRLVPFAQKLALPADSKEDAEAARQIAAMGARA